MLRKGLFVAIAIVLVANAATLAMIAVNRSGEPDATVQVTEREARVEALGLEGTDIVLALAWERPGDVSENEMPRLGWFDRPKLQSLGFDCSVTPDSRDAEKHYAFLRMLGRQVYAVLEYRADEVPAASDDEAAAPGSLPASQLPSGNARRFEPVSEVDRTRLSRLVPVDVGTNPAALRKRYPDRQRFIVAPAMANLRLIPRKGAIPARLAGEVMTIMPSNLYVPKEHRTLLDRLLAADKDARDNQPWQRLRHDPRYRVTVKYGRRLEPWIVGIEPMPAR